MRLMAASGPEREPLTSPRLWLKCASFRSLLGPEAVGCHPCQVIFGGLSGPVFEGSPVPLISQGTPLCERAPSPVLLHCSVLFLYPRSPHSVKLRGTSSISPVPHVNRRFNQTLLLGLPPSLPLQHTTPTGEEKRESSSLRLNVKTQVLQQSPPVFVVFLSLSSASSVRLWTFMYECFPLRSNALCFKLWHVQAAEHTHAFGDVEGVIQ